MNWFRYAVRRRTVLAAVARNGREAAPAAPETPRGPSNRGAEAEVVAGELSRVNFAAGVACE